MDTVTMLLINNGLWLLAVSSVVIYLVKQVTK